MDAHNFIEEPRFPKLISDILGTKFTKKEERNWSYQGGNGAGQGSIWHTPFPIPDTSLSTFSPLQPH